tara:strand:- start:21 stop:617 length:597 start_codon:yes stop_codon:yes gene_type:complete
MKNSNLFNCLGLIILIVTVYLLCIHYYKSPAINIEPELLFHILQPGTYTGVSNYSATKLYKNGLNCNHKVIISKTGANDIDVVNYVTAYDNITNKLEYNGVRKVNFNYKPNHHNNLFKMSKSYINDKLVSSSYGYATGKTDNSISFNLAGSWHISNTDYTNLYNSITRTDKKTIDTKFTHLSFIGLNDLIMDEKYTMV